MSRIGKTPISIPSAVSINAEKGFVTVKGPKGELSLHMNPEITCEIDEGVLSLKRPTEQKRHKALHGLYRSLINNMVEGVTKGYKKEMELVGVGYKASHTNNVLELSLGYSHNIFFVVPDEIKVSTQTEKGKTPKVIIEGIDKQLVGQVAVKIKSLRKVEPFKGKGVRYIGEYVRRKVGKSAAK